MKREVFDDLWDKADKEHSSQGNNSFTFKYHLFAVLDDELKEQQQPQLTIPKSIADELDQIYYKTDEHQKNIATMVYEQVPYFNLETWPEIRLWLDDDINNENIMTAYLAGKALGVDLVKVVADEN